MEESGTTLLELMLAVALIVIVVATITVSLPKASRSVSVARNRWLASNYATAAIQQIKSNTYATIALTPGPPNTNFGVVANCNCSDPALPWSTVDQNPTVLVDSGISYTRSVCINLIQPGAGTPPTFSSVCSNGTSGPTGNDRGLKMIRVHVQWNLPSGDTYYTEAESLATRS